MATIACRQSLTSGSIALTDPSCSATVFPMAVDERHCTKSRSESGDAGSRHLVASVCAIEDGAVVAHKRHQRSVWRQCDRHILQTCLRSTALCPELGASLGQRAFGRLAVAAGRLDQAEVLSRGHLSRTAHHQVGQALLRGGERDPDRIGRRDRGAAGALPSGNRTEDEAAATDQGVNADGTASASERDSDNSRFSPRGRAAA